MILKEAFHHRDTKSTEGHRGCVQSVPTCSRSQLDFGLYGAARERIHLFFSVALCVLCASVVKELRFLG